MKLTYTPIPGLSDSLLVLSDSRVVHIGNYAGCAVSSERCSVRPFTVLCCSRENAFPIWQKIDAACKTRWTSSRLPDRREGGPRH